MNLIFGNALVSCYVDVSSLLVVILLLILSGRIYVKGNTEFKLYRLLCLQIGLICAMSFVQHAMEGHTTDLTRTIALLSRSIIEILVIMTDVIWLSYVNQKLYGDMLKSSIRHKARVTIVMVYVVLIVINLFTGIVFKITPDSNIQGTVLWYIILTADFLIFSSSAVAVWIYDRKSSKVRFLKVTPMIIPLYLSVIPQFFTPYHIGIIGFVVGVTFLYISMISEFRFVDKRSGLYSKEFVSYLFDLVIAEKNDIHSALIIKLEGNVVEGLRIIKDILHKKGDVMRIEDNKCLMFSSLTNLPAIQYILTPVDEAVEKYNLEHPQEKVVLTARSRIRTESESSFDFLRSSMVDNEEGSEMRGIVSMIDELDRLDKELSMAADIQMNNLPVTFPERKEFDLYASMTPAKEVGGDFYDFFLIDDDHLAMVIADVSGKGIPAALFMMVSKTLLKNSLMSGCGPAQALEKTNNQLCEHNTSMMFVTIWLAVLELSTGKGIECNAGHEKPAIYRKGESFEVLDYEHDVIAGVIQDLEYHGREFELKPGDVLFVYTDGLPEATNYDEEQFGEKRLVDALNMNAMAGPKELIPFVHEKVNEFVGSAPQFDDLTMLCLRYYGP